MKWLRRKWRSVSFRSGVGASLVVGTITALGLLLLSVVVFASFLFSGVAIQATLMDRLSNQLLLEVEPTNLMIEGAATDFFLEDSFWAVFTDGTLVGSGGTFDQVIIDAPFDETDTFFDDADIETDFDVSGTKNVGGNQWLVIEDTVQVGDESYLIVTGSRGDFIFRRFVSDGLPLLIPVLLIVMTVAGLMTSWFTRRALGSVEKMRTEVEHITQESLDRRVPTTGSGDRVDKLAETMNAMLERLEASTELQHQFLADASHELRSPVAGLVAQLDVAAAYPDKTDTAVLLPKLRAETQRLQLVLDDLLFLSRAEAERHDTPPPPGLVDIDELITAAVIHHQELRPDLDIGRTATTNASVIGNERDLARALRNLTDNAVRHAGSAVTIGVADSAGSVTITVSDDGAGITSEDADRIFDRFVRLDESRARDAGGSGLGLAIVREIVGAHGGTVQVVDGPTAGASFEIVLPTAA